MNKSKLQKQKASFNSLKDKQKALENLAKKLIQTNTNANKNKYQVKLKKYS